MVTLLADAADPATASAVAQTVAYTELVIHAAVILAGVPFLVRLLARLTAGRGVGLPADGAWPDVCWGREFGGFLFVLICIAVHVGVYSAIAWAAGLLVDAPAMARDRPVLSRAYSALIMSVQWLVTCGLILTWVALGAKGRPGVLGLGLKRLGAALRTGLKTLLAAMPAVLVTLMAALYIHQFLVHKPPPEHPVLEALQQATDPWQVAAFFALAGLVIPFCEELFYRGIIQTALLRTGSATVAIVCTAVLFGAVHLSLPNGATSAPALAVLGLALGYAYYRTGSLWAPVLMHALFNLYNLTLTVGVPYLADYLLRT